MALPHLNWRPAPTTLPWPLKFALALFCLAGALNTSLALIPAFGQAMDIAILDTRGYRASKLIGQPVFNEAGDQVGKVDEILLTTVGDSIFAVQVGPYIGARNRLVLFPFYKVEIDSKNSRIVATQASKEDLKKMAAFVYP